MNGRPDPKTQKTGQDFPASLLRLSAALIWGLVWAGLLAPAQSQADTVDRALFRPFWSEPAPMGVQDRTFLSLKRCRRSSSPQGPHNILLCMGDLAILRSPGRPQEIPLHWTPLRSSRWSMDHRGWWYVTRATNLVAFSSQGKRKWVWHPRQGEACSTPVADLAGNLYVLTNRGCLVTLSADTGRVRRRSCPRDRVFKASVSPAPLLGPDGTLYLSNNASKKSASGKVEAALEARARDGWVRWRHPVKGIFVSPPLRTRAGLICSLAMTKSPKYPPLRRSTLICLDGQGREAWRRSVTDSPAFMPLFVRGGRIYMATSTALFSWSEKGTLLKVLSLAPGANDRQSSPTRYVGPGPAGLITVANGNWVAVLNEDLQILWKAVLPGKRALSAPVLTGFGYLAVPTSRGLVLVSPPL